MKLRFSRQSINEINCLEKSKIIDDNYSKIEFGGGKLIEI